LVAQKKGFISREARGNLIRVFDNIQIWPGDPFAQAMIVLLLVLFVAWLRLWVRLWLHITSARDALSHVGDVADRLAEEAVRMSGEGDLVPDQVCDSVLRSSQIPRDGDIGRHIRTLFINGMRDASLDLGELNRRTSERVLGGESVLRVLLSTFVIVGLLGTLFGIAKAVAVFGNGQAPASAEELLARLPGAFTPSIWGVFFSIVGSVLYAFTRHWSSAFSVDLRAKTVELLIPKLVPTHTDRIDHAATRAVAAATRVVEFAESIEKKSGQLNAELMQATDCAQAISDATHKISLSVAAARRSTDKTLTDLDEKIRAFSTALDRFAQFRESIDQHESRSLEILGQIQAVAARNSATADEVRDLTRTGITDLLNATRELFGPVKISADTITASAERFTGVCQRLTQDVAQTSQEQTGVLQAQFNSWRVELGEGAQDAKRSLDNLREPFKQSAENLREQAANSILQMTALIEHLKHIGGELTNRLAAVVNPLETLAAKGSVSSNGNSLLKLSEEDWARIHELVQGPARFDHDNSRNNPDPQIGVLKRQIDELNKQIALRQSSVTPVTSSYPAGGDKVYGALENRLSGLDASIRELIGVLPTLVHSVQQSTLRPKTDPWYRRFSPFGTSRRG
jgi:hypothetical protein